MHTENTNLNKMFLFFCVFRITLIISYMYMNNARLSSCSRFLINAHDINVYIYTKANKTDNIICAFTLILFVYTYTPIHLFIFF